MEVLEGLLLCVIVAGLISIIVYQRDGGTVFFADAPHAA